MSAYAEGTSVSPAKSQQEIISVLRRYGAEGFLFGEELGNGVVAFKAEGRTVRFVVPLQTELADFLRTPTGKRRSADAAAALAEAENRRRWRSLALAIKAKLEVVATGISTFEEEFLAQIVLPDNSTIGQWAAPQVAEAYETGQMPGLLPGVRQREIEAAR